MSRRLATCWLFSVFGAFQPLSLLPENQVECPAASDVKARLPPVVQDARLGTARFLQGICKNRKSVERTVVVDRLGEGHHSRCAPCQVKRHGVEGEETA